MFSVKVSLKTAVKVILVLQMYHSIKYLKLENRRLVEKVNSLNREIENYKQTEGE